MGFMEDAIDEGMSVQRKELNECDQIIEQVKAELYRATRQHGPMKSGHEGYAVILEEMDELWHEIKHGTKSKARKEAVREAFWYIDLPAVCVGEVEALPLEERRRIFAHIRDHVEDASLEALHELGHALIAV